MDRPNLNIRDGGAGAWSTCADVDFRDAVDTALFAYSYDGSDWTWLGDTVQMQHDLAHVTGYRFALFNYAMPSLGDTSTWTGSVSAISPGS